MSSHHLTGELAPKYASPALRFSRRTRSRRALEILRQSADLNALTARTALRRGADGTQSREHGANQRLSRKWLVAGLHLASQVFAPESGDAFPRRFLWPVVSHKSKMRFSVRDPVIVTLLIPLVASTACAQTWDITALRGFAGLTAVQWKAVSQGEVQESSIQRKSVRWR